LSLLERKKKHMSDPLLLDSVSTSLSANAVLLPGLAIPLFSFGLTYSISLTGNLTQYPWVFLSDSIDFAPASCWGSFGISIASFLLVFAVYIRYQQINTVINRMVAAEQSSEVRTDAVEQSSMSRLHRARRLNVVSSRIGAISAFSAHGVASFQYHNSPSLHLLFASAFFFCGICYAVFQSFVDRIVPAAASSRRIRRLRVLAAVTAPILIVVAIVIGFVLHSENETSETANGIIFGFAVLEILTLGGFMTTFVTFYETFKYSTIQLTVESNFPSTLLFDDGQGVALHQGKSSAAEDGARSTLKANN
jgi:MFS family permease